MSLYFKTDILVAGEANITNQTVDDFAANTLRVNTIQLQNSSSTLATGTSTLNTYVNKLTPATVNIIDSADSTVKGTVEYMVTKVGNVVTWLFGSNGSISFSGLGVNSYAIIDLVIPVDLSPYGQIKCGAFLDADVGDSDPLTFLQSAAINFQLSGPTSGKFEIIDTASPVSGYPKAFGKTELDAFPLAITYIANSS